jgi:small subunit ribosomal protein S4e
MVRMKRLLAPEFWKIHKKSSKWLVTPRPGAHKKFESIPLAIVLRDILKVVETGEEAKKVVKNKEVLVDNRLIKDYRFGVGLMDTMTIPKIKKYFRVMPSKKGLDILEISEKEHKLKICKITDKKILKNGKVQLNLHDGNNLLVKEDVFKTGDSILLELPEKKIVEHLKLDTGVLALITKGKNAGKIGKVKEIIVTKTRRNKVTVEIEDKDHETMKDYIFVVGKNKPVITVE